MRSCCRYLYWSMHDHTRVKWLQLYALQSEYIGLSLVFGNSALSVQAGLTEVFIFNIMSQSLQRHILRASILVTVNRIFKEYSLFVLPSGLCDFFLAMFPDFCNYSGTLVTTKISITLFVHVKTAQETFNNLEQITIKTKILPKSYRNLWTW